jgi:ferritin-like metal-binding protein YciE
MPCTLVQRRVAGAALAAAVPSGGGYHHNRSGGTMAKPEHLQDLYVEELRDLYNAEKQILKALPKMAERASNQELQTAFQMHTDQTERQVERLERIFDDLGTKPTGKHCKGMEGLIEEGKELLEKKNANPDALDAGLIAAAQKVEHYEIAGYGTVRTLAQQLGFSEHARLLQETLDEEGETDKKLTRLAESRINPAAQQG